MRLKDKVSIITGAGSGLGREIALLFAREGSSVVLAELNEESGRAVVEEIQESGGSALCVPTDVSRAADAERMVQETLAAFERIDILVNNAGINPSRTPLAEASEEHWDLTLAVNLKGVFLCSKATLPEMMQRRQGAILHIASAAGLIGCSSRAAYSASKGGVVGLTRSMAVDYAHYGIRVNSLCPGFVETELTHDYFEARRRDPAAWQHILDLHALERIGKPSDVASAALFLVSEEAPWITGLNLPVDGGFTSVKRI
jgi:NAD(P)-dependent dehydrogenase (short-subunit alcohol dehydrogenase family)